MMKKWTIVLISLLLLCLCAAASADTYATVHNTSSLNVRSGPGANYEWLGSVGRGGWVRVLGQSGNWYQVELLDKEVTGFMSKTYLKTFEGGYAGISNVATVSNPVPTQWLNLRSAPSFEAEVLAIFYNGAQCTVLNRLDGWYHVAIEKNGQMLYGYFRSEYLKVGGGTANADYTVSTANGGWLNVRSGPSYQAGVITTIPNGTPVSVVLEGKDFFQIMHNGVTGFVDSDFLKKGNGYWNGGYVAPTVPPAYATGNAVVQTGNSGKLNLRSQAYSNAKIIGRYANGTGVTVLEGGSVWCYVRVNADGTEGYMMTKHLNIVGGAQAYKTVKNDNGGSYVNLRSTPDKKSANVNVRVPVGATVTVLAWGEEWSQVSYDDAAGYMMTWFLR